MGAGIKKEDSLFKQMSKSISTTAKSIKNINVERVVNGTRYMLTPIREVNKLVFGKENVKIATDIVRIVTLLTLDIYLVLETYKIQTEKRKEKGLPFDRIAISVLKYCLYKLNPDMKNIQEEMSNEICERIERFVKSSHRTDNKAIFPGCTNITRGNFKKALANHTTMIKRVINTMLKPKDAVDHVIRKLKPKEEELSALNDVFKMIKPIKAHMRFKENLMFGTVEKKDLPFQIKTIGRGIEDLSTDSSNLVEKLYNVFSDESGEVGHALEADAKLPTIMETGIQLVTDAFNGKNNYANAASIVINSEAGAKLASKIGKRAFTGKARSGNSRVNKQIICSP